MNRGVLVGVLAALVSVAALFAFLLTTGGTREAEDVVPVAPPAAASREATPAAPAERTPAARSSRTPKPAPERAAPVEAAGAVPEPAPAAETAAPELGTLRVEADVPGAQVFIDRQFIGTAPVTAEGVKPGTHQLNVSAEGFSGIARTIDVEPGPRELMVRFREVRLDAKATVVHKHRMGSCRGELVATPQGLRYETDDKSDAFSITLAELEAFQVDYQDKNLRVKVRKGKQYNFTDPDGNADRLFVFHRDVDAARQRLARGDQPATN